MERKAVSVMMLTLLLIGMLTLASNFQPVKADQVCGVDIVHVGIWILPIWILLPENSLYHTWHPQVHVTVNNNGTVPINCTVNSYYYDNTTTHLIGTQNVTNLLAGENATLAFDWYVGGLPWEAVYTLKTNVTCHCGASDEFIYGQVKIRLLGDPNGDGKINILDLKLIFLAYSGLIENPFADVNGDGVINILDLKVEKLIYSGLL